MAAIPVGVHPSTVNVGGHVGEQPLDVTGIVWSYDTTKLEILPNPRSRESVLARALDGMRAGETVEAVGTRGDGPDVRLAFFRLL